MTAHTDCSRILLVAFELSASSWTVGLGRSGARKQVIRKIPPGDERALARAVRKARRVLGLEETCDVVSCYEAGRDGFWIHRWLTAHGFSNVILDSSSIKVDRRKKRAKSDRLDAKGLLREVERWYRGEDDRAATVRVPGVEDEDLRQVDREFMALKKERTAHVCRLTSLLATQGVRASIKTLQAGLADLRVWDGSPVAEHLRSRLERELKRLELVEAHVLEVKRRRDELIRSSPTASMEMVRQLAGLRGIAATSAWLFVMELFGWRELKNRRQVAAVAGLTPTPYSSGSDQREQGISKAGNRRVRAMAVEIAWSWLRWQKDSSLSQWFRKRFGSGSPRQRKIGIVAMARKLLIQLWKYLHFGELPEGAVLSS